jgi:hypothetical protein
MAGLYIYDITLPCPKFWGKVYHDQILPMLSIKIYTIFYVLFCHGNCWVSQKGLRWSISQNQTSKGIFQMHLMILCSFKHAFK